MGWTENSDTSEEEAIGNKESEGVHGRTPGHPGGKEAMAMKFKLDKSLMKLVGLNE